MRRLFPAVAAICMSCLPSVGSAQNPRAIFDFFLQETQRQQYLQQQEQYQQQLLQQQQQLYNEFLGQWNACFNNDIQACDQALFYPGLNQPDRERLLQKRQSIVAAQQYEEQQRRGREMEQARELERQRQAELERQRAETERQRIEAERQRAAEAERVRRQREEEERRIAALRAFHYAFDGCRRYAVSSCDAALASQLATAQDRANIANWRAVAEKFQADRAACQGRSAAACDAALTSPAADASDRATLEEWRAESSPVHRVRKLALALGTTTAGTAQSLANTFRELPTSTHITGAIAVLLAAALGLVLLRRRTNEQALPGSGRSDSNLSSSTPVASHKLERTGASTETRLLDEAVAAIDKPSARVDTTPIVALSSDTPPQYTTVHVEQPGEVGSSTRESNAGGTASHYRMEEVNPSPSSGMSIGSVLGNPAIFALLYILLMIPTYWLPYLGSNSAVLNTAGSAAGIGMNPAFWPHLGALALLGGVAWMRGNHIGKSWLVILPILALIFDLTPGLNFIPMVPTVMHLLAIILGVSGAPAPTLTPRAAPGGR